MWIAISVEFGPGIRFVAPSMSRNSSCEIHPRRRTNSSSIIAIFAAGPPKAVVPSRRNETAISRSLVGSVMTCGGSDGAFVPGKFKVPAPLRRQMPAGALPWLQEPLVSRRPPLAAEQRRFADRQSQRVAAQPVQRDLCGENLYPVARAAQLVAARGLRPIADQRDADRAYRMLGRAAV